MAQRGACGGRPVAIDDVYEHDEVARNAQLEAFFQWIEEWFDALSKQLVAFAIENWPQNCHPNPCYVEEEYFDVKEEDYDNETFNIKKQKVIDFTDYNHRLVQSVCSVVDKFKL